MRIISLMKGQWWWIFTQHSNYRELYFLQGGFRCSWSFPHHSFLGLEDFLEKPSSLLASDLNVLKHPFIVNPWPKNRQLEHSEDLYICLKKSWSILFGIHMQVTTTSDHNKSPNPTKSHGFKRLPWLQETTSKQFGNAQLEGMKLLDGKHCFLLVGVGGATLQQAWPFDEIWRFNNSVEFLLKKRSVFIRTIYLDSQCMLMYVLFGLLPDMASCVHFAEFQSWCDLMNGMSFLWWQFDDSSVLKPSPLSFSNLPSRIELEMPSYTCVKFCFATEKALFRFPNICPKR